MAIIFKISEGEQTLEIYPIDENNEIAVWAGEEFDIHAWVTVKMSINDAKDMVEYLQMQIKQAEEYSKEWSNNPEIPFEDIVKKVQKEAYNQALDDAAKSAVAYDTVPRVYSSCVVDKQSILKLKK